jgi:phage terminase Nu1 subunit (DNA packaging protein)
MLASWKEIAAYFKRDVRTVQLWEKRENFPVHRRDSCVYAFRSQIEEWRRRRTPTGAPSTPLAAAPVDRFESWKEIAAHFGRDVRTVQLWEKNAALPVHRQHHRKQSSVYAFKSQLDSWLQRRG